MKKSYIILLAVLIAIFLGIYFATSTGAQHREDLDVLQPISFDSNAVWCQYRITGHEGPQQFYKNGDIICITCCDDRDGDGDKDDPLPPKIQDSHVCWARISFKTQDGQSTYEAERVQEFCTECASPSKQGWYRCPNN